MKRVGLLLAALTLTAPAFAQPDPRVFDTGLAGVRQHAEAHRWQAALDELKTLLEAHADQEHARARRVEVVRLHRRCSFRLQQGEPTPAEVVHGKLLSYRRRSGKVRLQYTPKDLVAKAGKKKKPKSDLIALLTGGEKPKRVGDFDELSGFLWFTGVFIGPYTLTVVGTEFPEDAPQFFVGLKRAEREGYNLQLDVGPEGGTVGMYRMRGVEKGMKQTPIAEKLCRPRYTFRIKVAGREVVLHYNNRRVGRMPKPKDLFGGFAITRFNFKTITVEGKLKPTWMRAKIDAHLADKREAFEKKYDPKKLLPRWLFKKAKGGAGGGDFDKDYPGEPPNRDRKLLKKALKHIEKRKFDKAADLVKEAPDDKKARGAYLFVNALALYGKDDYDGAMTACQSVRRLHPDYGPARLLLGKILVESGNRARGLEVLSLLADESVDEPEVYASLAMALLREARPTEARKVLSRGLRASRQTKEVEKVYRLIVKAEDGPGWTRPVDYKSPNYHVISDMDKKTCAEAARVLEAGFRVYNHRLKWTKGKEKRFKVYLFSTQRGFVDYTKDVLGVSPTFAAGLYSPHLKQLLIWDLPDREAMMRTVRHEGFHQYFDRVVPDPPSWFNEGLAEYYETAEYRGGRWKTGVVRRDHKVELIDPMPLEEFIRLRPRRFYSGEIMAHYAQGWALVYFLQHGPEKYRPLFQQLFEALQGGGSGWKACERVLRQADLKKLERDFRAYVERL